MKSEKPQKASLQTKTNKIIIIIDPKENTPLNGQKDYLKACMTSLTNCITLGDFRATIIHDRDIDENGEPKTIHMHGFFQSKIERTLKEWLSIVKEITGAEKEQISIEATYNEYLQVQYLRHDRKENKAKYEASEILTNDSEELERRLKAEYVKPKDPIEEALKSCKSLNDLVEQIGYQKANQFRGLFKDLHQTDFANLEKAYKDLLAKHENLITLTSELLSEIRHLKNQDAPCRSIRLEYFEALYDSIDL